VDVGGWLRELGLEQYEAAFRENGIDAEVLPTLTGEELKDIGVSLIRHRRRLLDAIAALRLPATPAEAPAQVSPSPPVDQSGPPSASESTAERRPLSVMFCDLIGSTALSARLDPEDLREVIRGYQACVAATIRQFDGFIARYVGDGVLIYFGWPQAHETDTERAVRAGLAVAAAVSETQVGDQPLQVRIGIATGLVVIGEPIGSGDSRQQTAIGETPNRAARLQSLAGPGQVVIDAPTRRQIGGLFTCQDIGTVALKGLPELVPAWQVVSENRTLGQFEALRSGLTPLVGREEEIELLLRRWTQAKAGNGKVVLISAEPGVGKSRLAEALVARVAPEPHFRLRYFCSPHHQDSALYPVIAQMERAAGFAHGDTPDVRLAKLQALLNATEPPPEDVALIAELHGLPTAELAVTLDLTPQRRKEKLFGALLRQLEGLSRQQPVLMIFDDLHWIDPSSRELLDRLIERIADWPVLLLAMFRPEFQPPWTGQPQVTLLTLARLDRRDTAAMVANVAGVAGNAALLPEIMAEIAERADGVPLFVEELTKAVLEAGAQAPMALSAMPHPGLSVPATLHASLMARLDRLGPAAKEVAQTGAAIGREFDYGLLSFVTDLPEPQLREALDRLTSAGLVFARGTPPEANYLFKHALMQDSAYGSLLRSRRQELHARIARACEEQFLKTGELQPEVLAHHFTEAKILDRAVVYWRQAGERASKRFANQEAIAHLTKGLDLLKSLPETSARRGEEFALRMASAVPLIATKGYSALEVEKVYIAAKELCEQIGRTPELFPVLRGLWNCYLVRGELVRARDLAEQVVRLADVEGDPLRRALSRRALGSTLFFLGRVTEACQYLDEGTAIADSIAAATGQNSPHLFLYGESAGVMCRLYSAWGYWYLGFPDRALARVEAGLALCRQLSNAHTLGFALIFAATVRGLRREYGIALKYAEEAVELASEHALLQWHAGGLIVHGFAQVGLGQHAEALANLQAGLAGWKRIGAGVSLTQWLSVAAEAHAGTGQFEEAFTILDQAVETGEAIAETFYTPELLRLRGEWMLASSPSDEVSVEKHFHRALKIARQHSMKALELRASTSLARLWRDQGKRAEAHSLLAPIYGWFTEGFDAPDLKDAKALLDELA
jgi:class 3 adenylate cyclase/predicted ATPase